MFKNIEIISYDIIIGNILSHNNMTVSCNKTKHFLVLVSGHVKANVK